MSFAIPTLSDLVTRSRSAFRAYLPGSDAWLWPNNVYGAAKVIGGMIYEVFGFADYIQRQKFAGTADTENLDLHGQEYGLSRRPAGPGRGYVQITATDQMTVGAGAVFTRTDGLQYTASVPGSLASGGTLDVEVVAVTDGKASTAEVGTPLAITSGVTVASGTPLAEVADGGVTAGVDVEPDGPEWTTDLSTFRGRILFRKRNPPHGGAPADYVMWSTDASGVTRVFVERRWAGTGTVRVFVVMDDLYANGIPPSGEIARVAAYIATLAPAAAVVTCAAPVAKVIDVTISGLTPDTVTVRENVLAELRATFRRLSRVAGNDVEIGGIPFLAYPVSFSRSWLWQAVANASGEERHAIASPSADVPLAAGEMPVLGTVTFTA